MNEPVSNPYQAPIEVSEKPEFDAIQSGMRFPRIGLQIILWSVVLSLVFIPGLTFTGVWFMGFVALALPVMFFVGQVLCLFVPEGSKAKKWAALSLALHVFMWLAMIVPSMLLVWTMSPDGIPNFAWISVAYFFGYGSMLGTWSCAIKFMGTLGEELKRPQIARNGNRIITFAWVGVIVFVLGAIFLTRFFGPTIFALVFGFFLLGLGIATVATSRSVVLAIDERREIVAARTDLDGPNE